MKLVNHMVGTPVAPDYEMLRDAVAAAQAVTATARVATRPADCDATAVLSDLIRGFDPFDAGIRTLGHGFAPPPARAPAPRRREQR